MVFPQQTSPRVEIHSSAALRIVQCYLSVCFLALTAYTSTDGWQHSVSRAITHTSEGRATRTAFWLSDGD